MNGNQFGTIFRITTWGESHGTSIGVVVDGCPSNLPLHEEDFHKDLGRRQGGSAAFTTPRKESDLVRIESGVFEGKTTGTPIALRILNENQVSSDYEAFRNIPRPGHADLTTYLKHGHRDHRGGGRASARETAARVAAGVIAKKLLARYGIEIGARVSRMGKEEDPENFGKLAAEAREKGDSLGGAITCEARGLPSGIGEPNFDKLPALLAHALMSLPAATGFECGGGIPMSERPGSEIRDAIGFEKGMPRPVSNRHGGVLGGMSTSLPLLCKVHFHAPTSIPREIESVNLESGNKETLKVSGRHDAVPLPRAVPMVEAMVAIVLADLMLRAGRMPEKL